MKYKNLINRSFSRVERFIGNPHFNLFQTIYVNFRLLSFKTAIKFPIFIYGHLNIISLAGRIEIKGDIKKAMITVGKNSDKFYPSSINGLWCIPHNSKIIFQGPCYIGNGSTIRLSQHGYLTFGEFVRITSHCKICCENQITVGKYTTITFNTQIRDTNFHYILNTQKQSVAKKNGTIELGDFNWIGNSSTITQGTVTSDYTIVASGSLLNKNYIKINEGINEPLFLVGTPASIKAKGLKRIFSPKEQKNIDSFFAQHPEMQEYAINKNFKDEYWNIFK